MRLANWRLDGEDEQIFADVALVDLLLTPPVDAWAFLRRQVLLPLDVATDRLVQEPSTRSRSVVAAALHVPRILGRFALALLATTGRRRRNALASPGTPVRSAPHATPTTDP